MSYQAGHNETSSETRPTAIRTGAAALVSGRSRARLGRLILTGESLSFVSSQNELMLDLALLDMAWIDVSPRARQLTLEVTMRGAVHHYLRVPSIDWVSTLRKARQAALIAPAIGMHDHPVALAG